MKNNQAELFIQMRCELGEGPFWDEKTGRLHWLDILNGTVFRTSVTAGNHGPIEAFTPSSLVAAVGLRKDGGCVASTDRGLGLFDLPMPGTAVSEPEKPVAIPFTLVARPGFDTAKVVYNDGKCGPDGAFWAGSKDRAHKDGLGLLERVGADGKTDVLERDLVISNGLGWSPDLRRFYLTDSPRRAIYRYDYDAATGSLSNRTLWIDTTGQDEVPDGLAVDSEGCVWSARWGGARLLRYSPDGVEIGEVSVPGVSQVSSCCFGGSDMKTLFITSALEGFSPARRDREALAGSVFAFDAGVRGLPFHRFGA
jgi:sugar lactone lactonase YvrE